jgi:hypothetical protein
METPIYPAGAPRREPPNDPKKPPVKPPPRKKNPPVKEPPDPPDIDNPLPRERPPIGDPPGPARKIFHHNYSFPKFINATLFGTFVAVRINHTEIK